VLHDAVMLAIATAAFFALFGFDVPFPLVVIAAAAIGFVGSSLRPGTFAAAAQPDDGGGASDPAKPTRPWTVPSARRALRVTVLSLLLWFSPIVALAVALGADHVFVTEAVFFSKAATVTFGGAYAVLSYIAQEAVETHGWLRPGEMLDGLGMAEATPGPLIQVVQFVGYMGAYRNPGALEPWVAGVLGSVLTTWVTFVPCFFWIFLGAPYVETLRGNRRLTGALSAITAAVVGVICNLALWLAIHVLFAESTDIAFAGGRWTIPVGSTVNALPLSIAVGSAIALLRFRAAMLPTLAVCAALGLLGTVLWPASG